MRSRAANVTTESGWSPGLSFSALVANAPAVYVRSLLGTQTSELLDLIDGGSVSDSHLRDVASSVVDVNMLLADPVQRTALLDLLPDAKAIELYVRLGGETPEPDGRPELTALPWTPDQQRIALGFLGGRTAPEAGTSQTVTIRPCEPSYGLFPHQLKAVTAVQTLIYNGERKAVLHLPTGVGKTRTAMYLVADHLRRNDRTVVVWLAHGQELLEQAALEFERAWSATGNRPVSVVRLWGSSSVDLEKVDEGIVVLSLEKAVATAKKNHRFLDQLGLKVNLTVFDEAHQAIAPTYRRVVDALTLRRDASLLGLTATPGRTWADISVDEELARYFARQKVTLEIEGYDNPVSGLIEEGYLARPQFRTVGATSGLTLDAGDRAALAVSFDIPERIVQRLAVNHQWNLQVIKTVLDLTKSHQRILLFAASVAHCRLLTAVLNALDVETFEVTGETAPDKRERAIMRFKSSRPRPVVLCNYNVLTTGFDAPAASAAVIARPTRSLVLYSQMVGRVIRGVKAGGTQACEIVTVTDPALPGFGSVAEAFTNWEDVWQTT